MYEDKVAARMFANRWHGIALNRFDHGRQQSGHSELESISLIHAVGSAVRISLSS